MKPKPLVTPESIANMQKIYKERFNKDISDEEAAKVIIDVCGLIKAAARFSKRKNPCQCNR